MRFMGSATTWETIETKCMRQVFFFIFVVFGACSSVRSHLSYFENEWKTKIRSKERKKSTRSQNCQVRNWFFCIRFDSWMKFFVCLLLLPLLLLGIHFLSILFSLLYSLLWRFGLLTRERDTWCTSAIIAQPAKKKEKKKKLFNFVLYWGICCCFVWFVSSDDGWGVFIVSLCSATNWIPMRINLMSLKNYPIVQEFKKKKNKKVYPSVFFFLFKTDR